MYYCYGKGVQKSVLCREVVPFLEGPLLEVLLYFLPSSEDDVMLLSELSGFLLLGSTLSEIFFIPCTFGNGCSYIAKHTNALHSTVLNTYCCRKLGSFQRWPLHSC